MIMPTAGNVPAAKIANCHTHPVAFAAEVFTVHDLLTGRRSRHAAAILGPPVVLHELVAVAVDPGLAVVADTPESAKKAPQIPSTKATTAIPHNNFCQPLTRGMLSVGKAVRTTLDPAELRQALDVGTSAKRSPR